MRTLNVWLRNDDPFVDVSRHAALTRPPLRSAHRELAQRRDRAAKLARLAAEMASAKAASGKGTKRKLPPQDGAPPQFKFKTERKK